MKLRTMHLSVLIMADDELSGAVHISCSALLTEVECISNLGLLKEVIASTVHLMPKLVCITLTTSRYGS